MQVAETDSAVTGMMQQIDGADDQSEMQMALPDNVSEESGAMMAPVDDGASEQTGVMEVMEDMSDATGLIKMGGDASSSDDEPNAKDIMK